MDYRQQIFQLAKSFINIPLDQVDTRIQKALQQTAEYFSADRAYVLDYNFSAGTVSNTYEWCAPGITKEISNLQNIPMPLVVEWITAHIYGDPVIVPDVLALPSQLIREFLETQQIKSLILLPMMNKTSCLGCVGFDAVTQHRHFGSEETDLLSLFAGLLVDLRERCDKEKLLRDKGRRLRAVIDGTQAGTWEWNVQTGETLFNDQWAHMLGLDLSDLEPTSIKTWQDLVNPDDMKVAERLLQQHFSGQTNFYRCEMRMRHKKGHWVWIQDTGRVYEWTKEGLPLLMAGTHQDVSWRKDLQDSLAYQHEKNQLTFERALDGVYLHDLAGRLLDVNQAACDQTGRKRDELLTKTVFDLDAGPLTRDEIILNWKSMKEGDVLELESTHRHANGQAFPVEIRVNKIYELKRTLILVHVRDISRRKTAEQELLKKEQFYRNALDSIPGVVYVSKPDGEDDYLNQFAQSYTGVSSSELLNSGWLELVHPEDRESLANAWQEALTNGKQFSEEFRFRRYDGQYEWFHSRAEPIRDESGRIERFFGIAQSIEASKQAALTIAKRESLLTTITNNINEAIVLMDRQHRLLYTNHSGIKIIGASLGRPDQQLGDLLDKRSRDFFPSDLAEELIAADEQAMLTGLPSTDEHAMMSSIGTRLLRVNRFPLCDSDGRVNGLVLISHDITDFKQQEQHRLDHLKRQRDTLVREVHHRIKNHLQGVLGLMHNSTVDQPDLTAMMEAPIRQIKSIADVYGINPTDSGTAITISELVSRIICSYPEQDQIEFSSEEGTQFLILHAEEAVPASLIINELLNNAVKHRLRNLSPKPVKISLIRSQELTCLTIASGPAYLPAGFNIDDWSCLGTGLELVKTLMPSQDSRLEFEQQGDEVVVTYCFLADSQPHISTSS